MGNKKQPLKRGCWPIWGLHFWKNKWNPTL